MFPSDMQRPILNTQVLAQSILSVFSRHLPVWMPFTRDRFNVYITDGLGVWTSHENKMQMLQHTYQTLLEGRMSYSERVVTANR